MGAAALDRRPSIEELRELSAPRAELLERYVRRAAEPRASSDAARAVLLSTAQLRERFRLAGYDVDDPDVRRLIAAGRPPVSGGATGRTAAAFARNLPAEGTYVMNPVEFARWTERNDVPLEQRSLTGLGAPPIQQRISNVGIMSALRVLFEGTLTVSGAGTVTANYPWPWNVIKRYNLNLNGQTGIISCEGLDLRSRHSRFYRNPRDPISSAPATTTDTKDPAPGTIANGTYSVMLHWDIPVAHDVFTLVGSIYAQSDQTYLQQQITPAAQAELFSVAGGSTVTLTGTFSTTLTFYDIPMSTQGNRQLVLIPDLRWLHGYFSADQPFANQGEVQVAFIRSAGQLTSFSLYLDNGGAAQIDPAALSALRFQYGGNRRPREYSPPEVLLVKNLQDYNGRIQPNWAVLDFEADNPERELVYPKGVTELAVVATIPTSITLNANARAHFVEETLFAGV